LAWPLPGQLERAQLQTSKIALEKTRLSSQNIYTRLFTDLKNLSEKIDKEKELITLVKNKLKQNVVPIVYAYSLGKGQEALYILSTADLPVSVDRSIRRFCRIYEKYGVQFGAYEKLDKENVKGKVVLLSAHNRSQFNLSRFGKTYSIYLSGWGIDEKARQRFRVDRALPFSDHSDYNELLQFVRQIKPKEVYCTHGFEDIVHTINKMGINARYLHEKNPIIVTT